MTDTPSPGTDAESDSAEHVPSLERLEDTPTRATHVTLFEDRAQVRRVAEITIPRAGIFAITLTGITRFVDDQSLTLDLEGKATLALVQIKRKVISSAARAARQGEDDSTRDGEEHDRQDAASLSRRQADLEFEREAVTRHIDRLRARITHLHDIYTSVLAQIRLAPDSQACTVGSFQASLSKITSQLQSTQDQEAEAQRELVKVDEELALFTKRLEQSKRVTHEIVAHVEVQLRCDSPGPILLTLDYTTGGALWRPSHRAQLSRAADAPLRGHIDFETRATIWQNTGERWHQVTCSFSTARPTQNARPPILEDDVLYTRHKTHEERHSIQVTARDETIARAGQDGAHQLDVMPGVDDGGEPLLYEAESAITIASTGRAHHVTIDRVRLPCRIDVVAMPELSPVAHLRARTIWSHPTPLLAGPVTLLREHEHAGQARLTFSAPGEPLDIGFGPIATLRVRREVKRKNLDKMLTRKNHQERKILLHVANMGATASSLHIVERIPVSEIEQVEILLKNLEGGTPDEDGLLSLPLELAPNQTRTLELHYEIVSEARVDLDF